MTDLLVTSALFTAQLTCAVTMFAKRTPRRRPTVRTVLISLAALTVIFALPWVNESNLSLNPLRELAVFVSVLGALVIGSLCVWNIGPWPALFCATAGYTIQNLTSSLEILAVSLAGLPGRPSRLIDLSFTLGVYALCYLLLARRVDAEGLRTVRDRSMLAMFAIVSFVVIGFDVILKNVEATTDVSAAALISLRLVHVLACVFVLFSEYQILFVSRLREERASVEQLLTERERQWEQSQESVEALNIRLHDLRHLIRDCGGRAASVEPGALEEIEREVSAYDTAVKTGNAALDTVLTEKVAFGRRRGVQLLCTADGAAIGFMRPSDLYALFGNALDNAIEAAAAESDPERRVITLSVRSLTGMAAVNVENYCSTELDFRDGLPLTTKDDKNRHGFGMKSMRLIAERYGGSLEASQHGDVFSLNILLSPAGTTSATS